MDFETASVLSFVEGSNVINKFGRNTDVDTATVPEDIWGGSAVYAGFPTTGTAEVLRLVSSSANDSSAGSGARTVMVTGLDENYNVISETITLNGTTPVTSTQSFWRAHTANVRTSGGTPSNSAFNAGTITISHNVTTANVFVVINPGLNQSNCSAYTVPAGYTGFLKRIHGAVRGAASASVDVSLWIRLFGFAPRLRRPTAYAFGSELDDSIWGGLELPEKTDIILRVTQASNNNLDVVGRYDLLILKNN